MNFDLNDVVELLKEMFKAALPWIIAILIGIFVLFFFDIVEWVGKVGNSILRS